MRLFKLTMPCIAAVAFLLTVCPATGSTMNSRSPKHEVRAVWLTTIGGLDWPHTYARTAGCRLAKARIMRNTRPSERSQCQHGAVSDPNPRHHDLSVGHGTVGRMPVGPTRTVARIRRFAVCHRRMPQAGHGAPWLGGYHTHRQVERDGLPENQKAAPRACA